MQARPRLARARPRRNITERVTGARDLYDIKDLDVSFDGLKVVFAMRGPLDDNQDEEDPPTWNIWEYDIATDTLHRVIASDIIAGEGNDVAPHYLPDGRILFSSTRQRQSKAILLDEGKPQFEAQTEDRSESAFVLHVMNADGTGIHQISFNQSHDLRRHGARERPRAVEPLGPRAGQRRHASLHRPTPTAPTLQLHYGANSHT